MSHHSTFTMPFPPSAAETQEKADKPVGGWVGRICVEETVPDQVASYKLDSWYSMVRSMAFNELMNRLEPHKGFSMQCEVRHEWRDASNYPVAKAAATHQSLVVVCEINYQTEE